MRFHLPTLPGRPTIRENSSCAYTQKVRKFATMMTARGHEVYLYGGPENDAEVAEHVACYPDTEPVPFDVKRWEEFNDAAAAHISERAQAGDFLCLIAGECQRRLAEQLPELLAVEFGIGYGGVFADFKVFESYAWMHMVYGSAAGNVHAADGHFFDAVIPNYFELDEYPLREEKEEYLLYLGRMIDRKGVQVAADVAQRLELPLILAGEGEEIPEGEYVAHAGPVGPDRRAELLGGARALLAPTLYVEPFGGAAVEAMLCGTPAITTDWGGFTETVVPGLSGFRCRTLGEFCAAVERADELPPRLIREYAASKYATDVVDFQYEQFFEQLQTLSEAGWYSSSSGRLGAGVVA